MTNEELPQPGVEVVQVFRATSPTVITPTLISCVVGVCKQILEIYDVNAAGSSSLNGDALIQLPAFFEAPEEPYVGLDGLNLVLSVNYGPDITILFSDPLTTGLSAATVVSQVTAALTTAGVTSVVAEMVGEDKWRLRSVGIGEFQRIYIDLTTDPAIQTAFAIGIGKTYTGLSGYNQYESVVPQASFPDPNGNLDELAIDNSSVRAFLYTGAATSIYEPLRTSAFLCNGVVDDVTDAVSTAEITELGNPGWYGVGGTLDATSFSVQFLGEDPVEITFDQTAGHLVDETTLIARIMQVVPNLQASLNTVSPVNALRLHSLVVGYNGTFTLTAGAVDDALAILTLTAGTYAGTSIMAVDDGNGDAVTPILSFLNENFTADPLLGPATIAATGPIDFPLTAGSTLILSDGGQEQTIVFDGTEISVVGAAPSVQAAIEGVVGPGAGGELEVTEPLAATLEIASTEFGTDSFFHILGGTALPELDPGLVTDAVGTLDILEATNPGWYGVGGTLDGTDLYIQFQGQPAQQITFSGIAGHLTDETTLAARIEAVVPDIAVTVDGITGLPTLHSLILGGTFTISVGTIADALAILDPLLAGTYTGTLPAIVAGVYRGTPSNPEPGDELWIDGSYVGLITQVAPGGVVSRLKVDTQLTINPNVGSSFYIVAKNLPNALEPTRPDPDLTIDLYGNAILKPEILRDVFGDPVTSSAPLYITYTAIRLDVTAKALRPGLLKLNNTTEIEESIPPITTDNPLALGMYFAAVNAPGSQITGLGVDAVSADAPYGTVEAFTRAAEYLEAFEVYGIAPLTHDESVGQVFNTHVLAMSEPEAKGERIVLWNPSIPAYARDTLVASGNDGNSSGPTGLLFDTKVTNLTALVTAQGINPVGVILTSKGLFLDIVSDDKRYSISGISGSIVTIRTTFAAGDNDDGYYSTTDLNTPPLPTYLIQEQFSIKVRGAALLTSAGLPDKDAIADNIQAIGRTFQNRRFWMTVPDQAAATLSGVETVIEGFYMNAGIVGMIGQLPPQQSFTNFPMSGYTRVIGSNDYFTTRQLNRMAAGGAYIIVQEAAGAPLTARMALTTDMTSVETRTDSITKVVDMTAKFQRVGLKSFIGRFNITQGFLDSLGTVIDGLLTFLADIGVLIGANVNNIIQDEDQPDAVMLDETLEVPFPCNYIRITMVI